MVDFAFGATAMASIFAIVDPLGVVPFFSVLTEDLTPAQKQNIISKACLTTTVTLGVFAVFGQWIFAAFGFTIPAFKIAGGAVLFTFILFHNADRIFRRLGRAGTRAVGRVMGLLLAAIAVQFILDGVIDVARLHGIPVT